MATTALGFDNWFETTLSGAISDSATTIGVNTAPTATEGYLVIDPDSEDDREIIYYTGKTANSVTGVTRAAGGSSASSHASGATVRMQVVAEHFEALQDGTALAASSIVPNKLFTGTGTTWAWQSWTPTWTNLTVTGSTLNYAKYTQIGKTVHFKISLTLGGGNVPSGSVSVSTPTTMATLTAAEPIQSTCFFVDTGTDVKIGVLKYATTTTLALHAVTSDATYAGAPAGSVVTSTVPFTWANTDIIILTGTYEAA